ncbi:carboxypeptidase S1 [Calycina marina]|uniref:Carboxypeptidase S1 n=1 Tax=Calycina marina TaxID=1763456 RepID=A0A9P7ZC07_9HELO|nr:carboxypeptidase S1 [Calycina marina]
MLFVALFLVTLFGHVAARSPPLVKGVTTIHSARKPGATISWKEIYLAGGPSQSSLYVATGQGGPCYISRDSNGTVLNPWAWKLRANVFYVDQAIQTGFSYDALFHGTLEQYVNDIMTKLLQLPMFTPEPGLVTPPFHPNATALCGTGLGGDVGRTSNTSQQIAAEMYQFTQVWVSESAGKRISLWTHYDRPVTFAYFARQNEKIKQTEHGGKCVKSKDTLLKLDTLGLLNACVASLVETQFPEFFRGHNTYGISRLGNNEVVNGLCLGGLVTGAPVVGQNFYPSNRSGFDITQLIRLAKAFLSTGDPARANIPNLNYILNGGYKVAMAFRYRDYRGNWINGERSSGYQKLITNLTYIDGVTRQSGGFSFSRVFEVGHYVHAQNPETVYRIFNRAMFDRDIPTGLHTNSYRLQGPQSSFGIKSMLPPLQPVECSTW